LQSGQDAGLKAKTTVSMIRDNPSYSNFRDKHELFVSSLYLGMLCFIIMGYGILAAITYVISELIITYLT